MAETLTVRQKMAVDDRGGKLLVSAAAGSGKTKVLVDRLIKYLTDPVAPANVDDFLIITYTKAAAAELRGKIAQKISERIADEPENKHLQKQMQRLYLAKISTVHSFCADILRENAYRMDIPADFRVADENECGILQDAVMEQVLEGIYLDIDKNDHIRQFVDTQGLGRDDRQVPMIVLKVYHSARCHLDPDAWLDKCLENLHIHALSDASETVWGAYLIDRFHSCLDGHIQALSRSADLADQNETMCKPAQLLHETIAKLRELKRCNTWEQIHQFPELDFGKLTFGKNCNDLHLSEQIKAIRNACKEDVQKYLIWFRDSNEQVLDDLAVSATSTSGLIALVRKFTAAYDVAKERRRILDFADLEHKTLDLLLGRRRDHITIAADEIGNRFREIMVDEYQDSNAVQDAIFESLTKKRNNCFMVGDVKQSIYQFRLADPSIFIDKYNRYVPAEKAVAGQGRKVILTENFRSGAGVISAVNDVFTACMSKKVGGLDYGKDEMLYEGIPHMELPDPEVELHALAVDEDAYETEATYVAQRISELLEGDHVIRSKDGPKKITPGDIVILLRSPGSVGGDFCAALQARGIRCTMGDDLDVLRSEEVCALISLLQIVNNPVQDIPLIAALSSRIFGFTADDLASVRKDSKNTSFYEALRNANNVKTAAFLSVLDKLRKEARVLQLGELIRRVLELTDAFSVYGALADGKQRSENIQIFYNFVCNFGDGGHRDLTQLLDHLQSLEDNEIGITAEHSTADAVRIMSIHKSKGLEFPVVFLCGLSRRFNMESAYAKVLCDKDLGIGMNVVNSKQRVRYPNIAKKAISAFTIEQSISEELRVLYVAMTRAEDRLIMTYAKKNLEKDLAEIALRMSLTPKEMMTADVNCPGKWIMQTAICRVEAGQLRNLAGAVVQTKASDSVWKICIADTVEETKQITQHQTTEDDLFPAELLTKMASALHFHYAYDPVTRIPSKLTATQLKGRVKDREIAEHAQQETKLTFGFREPSFIRKKQKATDKGTAVHCFMQHANLNNCCREDDVIKEVSRLVQKGLLDNEQAALIDPLGVTTLANSEIGKLIRNAKEVIREFKFSILVNACDYYADAGDEKILLQGVVDCAVIESDGITVIDFKTDHVTDETVVEVSEKYRDQIHAYANALSRIYQLPLKRALLYFFGIGQYLEV